MKQISHLVGERSGGKVGMTPKLAGGWTGALQLWGVKQVELPTGKCSGGSFAPRAGEAENTTRNSRIRVLGGKREDSQTNPAQAIQHKKGKGHRWHWRLTR